MFDAVQGFIAQRNFPKAIGALRAQAEAKPYHRRLRLRLADVYVMAGREGEAVPVLLTLVDQFASDGFFAKAIALLKRIEKLDPGRRDVESRLAKLIQDKSRRTQSIPTPKLPTISASGMEFGFEVIDPSMDIQLGGSITQARPPVAAIPATRGDSGAVADGRANEAPPAVLQPVPEFDASFVVDSDEEDLPLKEDLSTPLFDGLSPDELVAVMRGLELVSFEPGDLIVAEGDLGDSMFILTAGRVKAYVRTSSGRSTKVQEFEEGDFFGEIAILTGKPRTATLTAAEPCDCLELSSAVLAEITAAHPGVTEVLKRFQNERALSTVHAMLAARG